MAIETKQIPVEFAYAETRQQWLLAFTVPADCTALELARLAVASIAHQTQSLPPEPWQLGLFSKPIAHDKPLQPGDRIELYRPLRIDPKQSRRNRAKASGRP